MAKKYTIGEVDLIILEHNWVATTCNHEPKQGTNTIQVEIYESTEYFGEFVGNDKDGYEFSFYTE